MDKETWFPEQSRLDAITATMKNFIHQLKFPVSKSTIEETVRAHPEYPRFSASGVMNVLEKWGIQPVLYTPDPEKIQLIPSPSLVRIGEVYRGIPQTLFVLFMGAHHGEVEYLHPRKGWVKEEREQFLKKWDQRAVTVISVSLQGEDNFEEKEKKFEAEKQHKIVRNDLRIIHDFLTESECNYILNVAERKFKPSTVMGNKNVIDAGRSSTTAKLSFENDTVLQQIRSKAAELIEMPESHFEPFQCVCYGQNQEYDYHFDTLDPIHEKELIEKEGQRKYTMLAYLNDDFDGGETHFPNLDLLVKPKKRSLLLFSNLNENDKVIGTALHAGKPVTRGRKYALNLWIRTKPVHI